MALKITLAVVRAPRAQTSAMEAAAAEYLRRCSRAFAAEARVFKTEAALMAAVAEEQGRGAIAFWIADPGGHPLSTEQFADRIRQSRDSGLRELVLAVGPADGWAPAARAGAGLRISLGAMTLPHELAALVLAEQVYRASTILQVHPYHLGH